MLDLANLRHPDGRRVGLSVRDGRIAAIGPEVAGTDAGGALLLPGLVEAHTHLDKSFLGLPWQPHTAAPNILGRIENERALKAKLGLDAAAQSARQVLRSVARGKSSAASNMMPAQSELP